MAEIIAVIGLGDYYEGEPGIREMADSIEELPIYKVLVEECGVAHKDFLNEFARMSGDGQENWLIVKGSNIEVIG